jgi:putative SOS response-associated peptidase YedK
MCTRFTFHEPDRAIRAVAAALAREMALPPEPLVPRWNVALTQRMPVATAGGSGPEWQTLHWGLVPFYERDQPQRKMLPNAKAETAAKLPTFRRATAQRRCLVPACGFYEWQDRGGTKWPHLFTLRDGEPFAFAGIWEPPDEKLPGTYAILTTTPNAMVAPVHNRMPVILTRETMPRWLGATPLSPGEYDDLTRPLDPAQMAVRPVARYVGNTRNEGPECHAAALPPQESAARSQQPGGGQTETAGRELPCGLG